MKKVNLGEFIFALDYWATKAPNGVEHSFLQSCLVEHDDFSLEISGEFFRDEKSMYVMDQTENNNYLQVADIDWYKMDWLLHWGIK